MNEKESGEEMEGMGQQTCCVRSQLGEPETMQHSSPLAPSASLGHAHWRRFILLLSSRHAAAVMVGEVPVFFFLTYQNAPDQVNLLEVRYIIASR